MHLHVENKAFPTIFKVTDMPGPIILGRRQAKAMRYIQFPQIMEPHAFKMFTATVKKICTDVTHTPETPQDCNLKNARDTKPKGSPAQKSESVKVTLKKQSKQTHEPIAPKIKWNSDSIELNGKVHRLPITKDYILKEYSDVFKGVGTLPGGPYHIRPKEQYKPVQHPPRSVPVAMQPTYKIELNRLVKEGIITEVKEHTEWINSIVPVMKSNGSLRVCLDPKYLNKAIKRNQWYSRTMDNIFPELAKSKYKTLKDATSGYWYIDLDLASSLLTMFNTPWANLDG